MNILVNNINIYYEQKGQGDPLILLHGNGESSEIYKTAIEYLSKNYTVYAIDSRCHGKSQDTTDIHYDDMAMDIICFIKQLELKNVTLFGFSDGAIVGLLVAIKEELLLKKLIVAGANTHPLGLNVFVYYAMKFKNKLSKNKKVELMLKEPHIKASDLQKISTPTYIFAGSRDMVLFSNTVFIHINIRHSKMKILRGETHSSYIFNTQKLIDLIENCKDFT